LMEKLRGRYEWRRERNWGRTFSTYPIVPERAPADVVHVPRGDRRADGRVWVIRR
jgi:hypothetical protein